MKHHAVKCPRCGGESVCRRTEPEQTVPTYYCENNVTCGWKSHGESFDSNGAIRVAAAQL